MHRVCFSNNLEFLQDGTIVQVSCKKNEVEPLDFGKLESIKQWVSNTIDDLSSQNGFNWQQIDTQSSSSWTTKGPFIDFEKDCRLDYRNGKWSAFVDIGTNRITSLVVFDTINDAEKWILDIISNGPKDDN